MATKPATGFAARSNRLKGISWSEQRQKWRAQIKKSGFHVDHIVAIARGGTNDARNLQVLCVQCNCEKHTKDQIEFMQSRGGLL